MRKSIFIIVLLLGTVSVYAQNPVKDSLMEVMRSRAKAVKVWDGYKIGDIKTPRTEIGKRLFRLPEHPAIDSLLTPETESRILAEINSRCESIGKDSLLTADLFYVMKPYLDWLRHEDPHCRLEEMVPTSGDGKNFNKTLGGLKSLPFNVLCVGDTVLVSTSLDPAFRTGDMLLSINGVTMPEYLKHTYHDRYTFPTILMRHYYFSHINDSFKVRLIRDGKEIEVETVGQTHISTNIGKKDATENHIRTYEDARCGYISIPDFFPVNSRLIKIIHSAVKDFKKRGYTTVILDMRQNTGGNGDAFDRLMSIFINKPTVQYQKGQRLKVSKQTLADYDFLTEDMVGRTIDIPDKYLTKEFATNPKMHVEGMNYYVLMSRNTGSIAASFCNILHYNGAAKLVGEPLLHNALKYGETLQGELMLPTVLIPASISTTEIDEYTKAVDGVLMPDIPIPYIAAEYMTGKDAVLEKLLKIIERH